MPLQDIETIVVVILENRSFDHALGYLSLPNADPPLPVDGLQDDPSWLSARANHWNGVSYPPHPIGPAVQNIDDPPHEQSTIRVQIQTPPATAPGMMGGFVASYMTRNPPPHDPSLVMGYYTKDAVPIFDFFARNFAVCDHWFAALPTGTQPNRLMAMSGESSILDNAPVFLPRQPLVYDWLTAHRVFWCAYQSGGFFPFFSLMPHWLPEITTSLTLSDHGGRGRFRRYSRFHEHWIGNDPMPSVIFIEPEYTDGPHADPNDDHPPTGIVRGQYFLSDIYRTLVANPNRWASTMMIVTYDEHGGFFDHVLPLPIPTNVGGYHVDSTGIRVPAFVISPHVEPGTVFTGNLDHTAILQLLADRFNPGQAYSASVGARQPYLTRLSAILVPGSGGRLPLPATPDSAFVSDGTFAGQPVADNLKAPSAAANAMAFRNVALKVAQDHPELLASPGWQRLATYVAAESTGTNAPTALA